MENPTAQALKYAKCTSCPLYKKFNPIHGSGNPGADLVLVGDNPNYLDVRARKPIAGRPGDVMDKILERNNTQRKDVWTTNAVLCQSQADDYSDIPPPPTAIACCRPRLIEELKIVQPKLVLSLGTTATKSLMQSRYSLGELQGVVEHRPDVPAPILPTYHPGIVAHGKEEGKFEDLLGSTKRAVRLVNGTLVLPDRNEKIPVKHVTDLKGTLAVLGDLLAGKAGFKLALDVETSDLSVLDAELLQVAIGNTERAAVIEADVFKNDGARQMFQWLMEDERFTWVIHNMSFDRQWIQEYFDRTPVNDIDTMCLALGLTEHKNKVGLKTLSREWLNAPYYEDEVHQYLSGGKKGWANVPRHILAKYAGLDVVYTARVEPILTGLCAEEGTLDLVRNVLEPAQRTFAEIERHGVLVDQTYVATLEKEWGPKVEAAERELAEYAASLGWKRTVPDRKERVYETVVTQKRKRVDGKMQFVPVVERKFTGWKQLYRDEPFNPKSQPQLISLIYDHLKLKPVYDDKTGNLSTGKPFRAEHANHPLVEKLENFSLINHMMSTYVRGIAQHIKSDGRVHPNIDIRGAVTGRLAMHNPPLQTIPRSATVKGFDSIKRMFLPSPGHVWLSADYSQLEIRCAWFLSQDEVLGEAVMSGDFHKAMAAKMFKKSIDDVTDDERQAAKVINFGILYGMSAMGLSERLGITIESAQVFIDDYFKGAPKFREWYFEQHKKALSEGETRTPFGRVRRWNLVTRENRQNVLNQSVNSPVQSLASDLNLTSFMEIHKELKDRRLGHGLFLVHDSIECEVREGREQEALDLVHRVMTTWPFDNPAGAVLDIDAKIGTNWGNVKPWIPPTLP
jgi:uracil-DNA glycosylase family 4